MTNVLGCWILGMGVVARYDHSEPSDGASFIGFGALLGAIFWLIYCAVDKHRTEQKLTRTELSFRSILPVLVLLASVLALLVITSVGHWFYVEPTRFEAVLLVIGFSVAYVAGGLLVLYLAVRVVRTAWYHGDPRE